MSSDFEGYEQDFAVLTAEITSKIARVPRLPPGEYPARPGGGGLESRGPRDAARARWSRRREAGVGGAGGRRRDGFLIVGCDSRYPMCFKCKAPSAKSPFGGGGRVPVSYPNAL